MKKVISALIALISVICLTFALGGCSTKVTVRGELYSLEQAYENGYFNVDDLKSIACEDYAYRFRHEKNPYDGMFTSTEKLTKKMDKELKQAYLEDIGHPEYDRDGVKINHYYGTYNGNVVVSMSSEYVYCDYIFEPKELGGVIFRDYWGGYFSIYHIDK